MYSMTNKYPFPQKNVSFEKQFGLHCTTHDKMYSLKAHTYIINVLWHVSHQRESLEQYTGFQICFPSQKHHMHCKNLYATTFVRATTFNSSCYIYDDVYTSQGRENHKNYGETVSISNSCKCTKCSGCGI